MKTPSLNWLEFNSPKQLGFDDQSFFTAVARACPIGSRLSFHHSEPESFVEHFRPWSHRDRTTDYEADYYTIDEEFVLLAERLTTDTALELDHHFHIVGPDGGPLLQCMDDFTINALTPEFHARLTTNVRNG